MARRRKPPKGPRKPPRKPHLRLLPPAPKDKPLPENVVAISEGEHEIDELARRLRMATAKHEAAAARNEAAAAAVEGLTARLGRATDSIEADAAATPRARLADRRMAAALRAVEARYGVPAVEAPAIVEAPAPAPVVVTRKRTSPFVALLQLAGVGLAAWAVVELVRGHIEAAKIAAANPATHNHHRHRHEHHTHTSVYPTEHYIDTHVVERAKPGPRGPAGRPGRDGRRGPKGERGDRGKAGRDRMIGVEKQPRTKGITELRKLLGEA